MGASLTGATSQVVQPVANTTAPATTPAPATSTTPWNVNTAAAQGMQKAMAGTEAGMGYQPQQVNPALMTSTGYNAATMQATPKVTAGQLSGTSMGAYTNPYESSVISGLQSDAARSQQMASNQLGAQATAAKAFGGSRHGIAEGQMAADIQRNLNNQVGQLRQSGYQNAQQMALADIQNRMQAGLANQGVGMQAGLANMAAQNAAGQFGATAANQAALQNINAINQAQQLNQSAGLAGAQQRLGAANQMGGMANQAFNMGQTINQTMSQQGLQQQALQQALMDAAKQQYAGYQAAPAQALGYLAQALGASPQPSTTTQSKQPGLFDYLTLAATAYGKK